MFNLYDLGILHVYHNKANQILNLVGQPASGWPCCDRQKDKGACTRKGSGSATTHFHDKLDH